MTKVEFSHRVAGLQDTLQYFARKFTKNEEDANDLLQETFYKALKYRDKFAERTNLKAWLYTIMRNTFINNYRKAMRANTIIDDTKELYYINIPQQTGYVAPDSEYAEKELLNAIGELDEAYRVPFEMHFKGYKYKEIAEELNLPIGTVKSRIFLARRKLAKTIKSGEEKVET